jgi:Fe2+ or Zn2+ uptake regulation protein
VELITGLYPIFAIVQTMKSAAANTLRDNDLRVTAQRMAVLEAIRAHPHATADDVADTVRAKIGSVSRQAVYDTLNSLIEKGLLRRIQPVGSPALYEDRVKDNHHHLICRICSRVEDVDCAVGEAPCLSAADDLGFEIDEAAVAYWGRCPECRAQGLEATPLDPLPYRNSRRSTNEAVVAHSASTAVSQPSTL